MLKRFISPGRTGGLFTLKRQQKNSPLFRGLFFVSALPIFPGRHQPSIVGANELNFRVRDGNGWTLIAISTDSISTDSHRSKPY